MSPKAPALEKLSSLSSLRSSHPKIVLTEAKLEESEWVKAKYEQLNMIEKKMLETVCHSQLYQGRLTRAFDTKVCPKRFEVGNLVLENFLPNQEDANGKWPQTIKVPTSSRIYSHEGPWFCKT
ncbi:hypothetical protein Lal_00018361 [Lupinus albus]|nr:hypothetical protein Lal_00018361 [Lupinus albus]